MYVKVSQITQEYIRKLFSKKFSGMENYEDITDTSYSNNYCIVIRVNGTEIIGYENNQYGMSRARTFINDEYKHVSSR